jgi:uncharacterized protein YggE
MRNRLQGSLLLSAMLLLALTTAACAPAIVGSESTGPNPPLQVSQILTNDDTLSVIGYGQASAAPDLALVSLGVMVTEPDVSFAVDQANILTEAVRLAMLGEGIADADIQTSNFNIWSEERYLPMAPGLGAVEPERQTVYRVENLMKLTVRDVEEVGEVIQSALDSGANQVRGVSFSINDATPLELVARDEAVLDAQVRADELASALGLELGRPISVSEGALGAAPIPVLLEKGGGGPPISGGEIYVSVQVNVEYELVR